MLDAGLRMLARENPEQPAVIHGAGKLSYAQLEANANRLAHVFRMYGLTRGDHIACLMPSGPEVFWIVWAAYRSGLYLTPLASTLNPREAAYIIDNCKAHMVIAHAASRTLAEALVTRCAAVKHWLNLGSALAHYTALEPLLGRSPDTPIGDETPGALMHYTAGAMVPPKGVWRPLLAADYQGDPPFSRDLLDLFQLGGSDVRYLSPAPLYHAASLRSSLAVTAGGGTVYVIDRFYADTALNLLESERITHSHWTPTMFQRLLALPATRREAFRAPRHRMVYHGAAPCPRAVKQAMIDWWGPCLLEYYAGTEGAGLSTITSQEWLARPGSVGRSRRGRVHILGEDGKPLPTNQSGRVYFSGHIPFAYFDDPVSTLQCTTGQGLQTLWDSGHLDADGYLYLDHRST